MQRLRVAAGQPMQPVDPAVGGVQQRPGAAGVVGNAEIAHPLRIRPARVVGNRQMRQQRRRFRASVVSSQKLAVGNQLLVHRAGQVVGLGNLLQPTGRINHRAQHPPGINRRINVNQHLAGNMENRPVIDVQYLVPFLHHPPLRGIPGRHHLRRIEQTILPGQVLMKYQGVDHYGGRNAGRLDVKILL